MSSVDNASGVEGIAVIGLAGRFPRARNVDEFWRNLRDGVECITHFTRDELLDAGIPTGVIDYARYVRAKGVLDSPELFDAAFFGYTPEEAQFMDPQHRLFLECGWTALEHAGYDPESYEGSIGVYAGLSFNTYLLHGLPAHPHVRYNVIAADKDFLSTRLSYKANLRGPSVVVQTACSTSLVAVCQACQALLTYQCDIALAGGVSVTVPVKSGYVYTEGAMFSPDGHCRAFDAAAQGIVPGNGIGIVALKRVADALADGDEIHAVIRGFGLNNDGSAKVGYTAPSIEGQAQAIVMAQELAGVSADTISYVEAHGTATPLGDPVEVAALTQAFRATTDRNGYCAIGSVKSNVGHLDTAAGVASLIKTVLALRHRQIPPTLHFTRPNPQIDFANSPFYVVDRLIDWPEGATPRRAGVSSFGIGGTNAHVVLEEAPPIEPSSASRPWQVVPLSAKTTTALDDATKQLVSHLESGSEPLADVAFTLQTGRTRFTHRRAVVCRDSADVIAALTARDPRTFFESVGEDGDRAVVFMFPGQGVQHAGMGAELYAQESVFRSAIDDCAALASRDIDVDLRRIICPRDEEERRAAARSLDDTRVTQPALFAVEYATACLWMFWGVKPTAMIGHSLGEYVAACLAGVLSLSDAMRLVCLRAAAMADAPPGAMLAVGLSESDVRRRLGDGLWLAAVNAPEWTVVSGDPSRIAELEEQLEREGVPAQRLHTAGAFHSGLMRDVAKPLAAAVGRVPLSRPQIPYISNLTGTWIREDEVRDPEYWVRQATEPVRFAEGIGELAAFGAHIFLEVGPGQTLGRLVEQSLARVSQPRAAAVVPTLAVARDRADDGRTVAKALAALWVAGVTIDWRAYYAAERRLRVALPTYPFERQRYWFDPAPVAARVPASSAPRRLDVADWFSIPSWKRSQPPRAAAADGGCLIFTDAAGLGDALAERLRARGRAVTLVRPGPAAVAAGADFEIDPGEAAHYDWLAAELRNRGGLPASIVHLWGVTGGSDSDFTRLECEMRCFHSLLHLARMAGGDDATGARRLHVVTDGVHDITGQERLNPFKALALGPCRVAPQEYTQLVCRHIDVAFDRSDAGAIAGRLEAEIDSELDAASVAWRGIDRWVPAVERMRLDPIEHDLAPLLREQGVYLITGGFGGIGLSLARYLARTVKATLVLTSRQALPHRGRWPEHLARRADASAVERIHAVQALEALGARVIVAEADVSDEDAMRKAVADVKEQCGRIDGVVHAAGVAGGGVIHLKTADAAARVLAPKVAGLEVLTRVLDGEPLAFMALCSSMTSVVGGFGQVDYCAANATVDAFARWNTTRRGVFTVALNWDVWREVGMSVSTRVPKELEAARAVALEHGISPAEGVDAFVRAIHGGVPQVFVSPWDATAGTIALEAVPAVALAPATAAGGAPRRPRPALQVPFAAPADAIQVAVCRVWEELLGLESVGVHDSFFDLGGHSVLAIQVVARLNQRFNTRVPVARLFEGMTPAFLADAIRGALGESVSDDGAAVPERRRERALQQKQQHQQRRQAARQVERSAVMESVVPQGGFGAKTGDRQ